MQETYSCVLQLCKSQSYLINFWPLCLVIGSLIKTLLQAIVLLLNKNYELFADHLDLTVRLRHYNKSEIVEKLKMLLYSKS